MAEGGAVEVEGHVNASTRIAMWLKGAIVDVGLDAASVDVLCMVVDLDCDKAVLTNIDSAGGSASDRMAFKVYALQRLHAAGFRGVAAVISSRPVIRTGPGVPPRVWPTAPGDRPP